MTERNTPFKRMAMDNFSLAFVDSAHVRQQKERLRHVIRQVVGVAERYPTEAFLGDRHAVMYKKISCLESIGGQSPSGIQNKLIVGKRRDRKSSVCCLLPRKDLRARRINTTGQLELRGGFMNYFSDSSERRQRKHVSDFLVSRLFFFSSGKYKACRQVLY